MSKYSNFEMDSGKTRNEQALEESLKSMKNYKNASQNFNSLDGRYFDDKNFYGLDNPEKYEDDFPNKFFNDPRYISSQTRNESRKQVNNKTNLKIQKTVPGYKSDDNFGQYEETNYENPQFVELFRDLALTKNKAPLKGFAGNNNKQNNDSDNNIERENQNAETDLAKIIKKSKKINNNIEDEDSKPVLRMPNKKISADTVKGKILQFKNCSEQIQDMICHALITIWKDDFAMKKISTYLGVKNFILLNFKDKLNCFFVLFDDDGDFISTFAVDTENFAPYVSHLFVNPNLRGKGFGKKSLKYAEKYILKLGFNNSNLWCEENLVPFYKKNGYNIDSPMRISEKKVVWKLSKNI